MKGETEDKGQVGMRKIYREIAKQNGVSVKEVKQEIQKMIEDAWGNPPNDGGVIEAYQRQVPCKGEIPTPDELIRYVAAKVQQDKK